MSFKPIADLKIPQARVLMIGPVGAGKSSFYNTINSILKERMASRACSGNAEQSLTTAVKANTCMNSNMFQSIFVYL